MVLSSDGFHIESHIDSVPALARVKDLHGGLSSGQQALGRIVQSLLADADALDGIQLYALSGERVKLFVCGAGFIGICRSGRGRPRPFG